MNGHKTDYLKNPIFKIKRVFGNIGKVDFSAKILLSLILKTIGKAKHHGEN